MLALDAHPDVAALARQGTIVERLGSTTVEAETAVQAGGATIVTPPSPWTGESQFSGDRYARLPAGATIRFTLPASTQPQLVFPVADRQPRSAAVTRWSSTGEMLGTVRHGDIGPQGASPAPGALLRVTLPRELPPGRTDLSATATGGEAVLDAVILEPLISRYVPAGRSHITALLRSAARIPQTATVQVPGSAAATIDSYDASGVRRSRTTASGSAVRALVLPGGFTVIRR